VLERNGAILAWCHAREAAPSWLPEDHRPGGSERWSEWVVNSYTVRTHVQELGENILDLPHFWNVHELDAASERRFEARFEAHQMIVEQTLKATAGDLPGFDVLARTTNSGPGLSHTVVRFGEIETITWITQTPLEENLLELQLHFCMSRLPDAKAMAAIEARNREFVNRQFTQDIPIWEHKIYREKPPLSAVDGPVPQYRKWFSQFYTD
jgi:hypothetical protein